MSTHYCFLLNLPLTPEQAVVNADALAWVLNPQACQPSSLPNHKFFETFKSDFRFHNSYRYLAPGSWTSSFWQTIAEDGACTYAGVNLCLPGGKLETVVQDLFPLTQWLASMSGAEGAVGIVVAEDLPDDKPMILYVRGGRLFVGSSNPREAYAVDDGSPYFAEV
jgi:hypothetical protein